MQTIAPGLADYTDDVAGLVTQLAFYAGWPNAVSALTEIEKIFAERRVDAAVLRLPMSPAPSAAASGPAVALESETIAQAAPKLAQITGEVIYGDLWHRTDLTPRDHSLVTIAALAASGDEGQLAIHIRRGIQNGLTRQQIGEALTHLAFYAGLPKATAAAVVLGRSLSVEESVTEAGAPLVIPARCSSQRGAGEQFHRFGDGGRRVGDHADDVASLADRSAVSASPAAKPPVSAMASPADQASEIARLRRELDRMRTERDILKRMGRPVRKGFVKDGMMVCIDVSSLGGVCN